MTPSTHMFTYLALSVLLLAGPVSSRAEDIDGSDLSVSAAPVESEDILSRVEALEAQLAARNAEIAELRARVESGATSDRAESVDPRPIIKSIQEEGRQLFRYTNHFVGIDPVGRADGNRHPLIKSDYAFKDDSAFLSSFRKIQLDIDTHILPVMDSAAELHTSIRLLGHDLRTDDPELREIIDRVEAFGRGVRNLDLLMTQEPYRSISGVPENWAQILAHFKNLQGRVRELQVAIGDGLPPASITHSVERLIRYADSAASRANQETPLFTANGFSRYGWDRDHPGKTSVRVPLESFAASAKSLPALVQSYETAASGADRARILEVLREMERDRQAVDRALPRMLQTGMTVSTGDANHTARPMAGTAGIWNRSVIPAFEQTRRLANELGSSGTPLD